MAEEWPLCELAPDWQEKLRAVPDQCWWAAENEPMYRIPPDSVMPHYLPHSVALKYGVVRVLEVR